MNEKTEFPASAAALHLIACVVAVILTLVLLIQGVLVIGHPDKAVPGSQKLANADEYRMNISNAAAGVLSSLKTGERPTYWIGQDVVVPPAPNQDCYGATEDPRDMQEVIDQAYFLLEGQELFFSPDMEIIPGSAIEYYLDDTILSISWKMGFHNTVYSFTEVKIAHPSQFRRFLSDGEFGSGKLYTASQMARSVNAVSAFSADYYSYRYQGVTVYNGDVKRANPGLPDVCFIDDQGDLILSDAMANATVDSVDEYVKDHNISFSLAFGPNLVNNGELVTPSNYPIGEIHDEFTRAALCQMDKLHYLVVDANMESGYYRTTNIYTFADVVQRTGCKVAYTLDGGQTATTVVNGGVFNNVNYGSERLISDIIYFATAIPDGGK